jgi:NADPH:quinone reductase-like Zn-dependent oxidoreductase
VTAVATDTMLAAYVTVPRRGDPLAALRIGELPRPRVPAGWVSVTMRAASLNMHDVGTLQGIRLPADRYPMILGCDGAGVLADGTEVVIHPCVNGEGWRGPETLDPDRSVLSELWPGTFAQTVAVPERNVVLKPASLSFADAACTGTAWLTAYRMVFVHSGLRPGQDALMLGRRGSITTAATALAAAAGIAVSTLAADGSVTAADGRPVAGGKRFDAVLDAGVDEAQWSHALYRLRPGGTVVCSGYRSGEAAAGYALDGLERLIFGELRLVGCAMGTRDDLIGLLEFLDRTGLRPTVAMELPLTDAADGIRAMVEHRLAGKVVFSIGC